MQPPTLFDPFLRWVLHVKNNYNLISSWKLGPTPFQHTTSSNVLRSVRILASQTLSRCSCLASATRSPRSLSSRRKEPAKVLAALKEIEEEGDERLKSRMKNICLLVLRYVLLCSLRFSFRGLKKLTKSLTYLKGLLQLQCCGGSEEICSSCSY